MTNKLREPIIEEEEIETKLIVEEKPVKEIPDNYVMQFLTKRIFNADAATSALPFVLFLAFLGMMYIANMNLAEKNVHDITKITKEIKELSSDYKTSKAELAFKSTLSQVTARADTLQLGIKESTQPPQKLTDGEVQNGN
jgi:Bacteriodetes cell division protein (FtsL-like)